MSIFENSQKYITVCESEFINGRRIDLCHVLVPAAQYPVRIMDFNEEQKYVKKLVEIAGKNSGLQRYAGIIELSRSNGFHKVTFYAD